MFCSRCGATLPDGSAFCTNCGTPAPQHPGSLPGIGTPGLAPPPTVAAPVPAGAYAAQAMFLAPPLPYAGFWLRLVAYLIDGVIMGICFVPVIVILVVVTGAGAALSHMQNSPPEDFVFPAAVIMFILFLFIAILGGAWLYYALMESSTWQATLGKKAIGLMVTDMEGKRLTFAHATGRYFAKMITGMVPLAIGYIMAGFTQKKQALHDFIAATLVLKRV
jgi:uncharacterized RDD family membrane protein YckC